MTEVQCPHCKARVAERAMPMATVETCPRCCGVVRYAEQMFRPDAAATVVTDVALLQGWLDDECREAGGRVELTQPFGHLGREQTWAVAGGSAAGCDPGWQLRVSYVRGREGLATVSLTAPLASRPDEAAVVRLGSICRDQGVAPCGRLGVVNEIGAEQWVPLATALPGTLAGVVRRLAGAVRQMSVALPPGLARTA